MWLQPSATSKACMNVLRTISIFILTILNICCCNHRAQFNIEGCKNQNIEFNISIIDLKSNPQYLVANIINKRSDNITLSRKLIIWSIIIKDCYGNVWNLKSTTKVQSCKYDINVLGPSMRPIIDIKIPPGSQIVHNYNISDEYMDYTIPNYIPRYRAISKPLIRASYIISAYLSAKNDSNDFESYYCIHNSGKLMLRLK